MNASIFISYASEDREKARRLARIFEGEGWRVWWDRDIDLGVPFDSSIHEAIQAASCVVVLWSRHAVESTWVRAEAKVGFDREVLVPVLLEHVPLPMPYNLLQAADLADWHGERDHEGIGRMLGHVRERLAGAATEAIRRSGQPRTSRFPGGPASPRTPVRSRPRTVRLSRVLWPLLDICLTASVIVLVGVTLRASSRRARAVHAPAMAELHASSHRLADASAPTTALSKDAGVAGGKASLEEEADGESTGMLDSIETVAGTLRFVSDRERRPLTEQEPEARKATIWLRIGRRLVWSFRTVAGTSDTFRIVWHGQDREGRDRVIIKELWDGNTCAGVHRFLVVGKAGLERISSDFAECLDIDKVRSQGGNVDIRFESPPLHSPIRARYRAGTLIDVDGKRVAFAFAKHPALVGLVGEHPMRILETKSLEAPLRRMLGKDADEFVSSMMVASDTHLADDWLIGDGGQPHDAAESRSVVFVSVFGSRLVGAMLRHERARVYGVRSLNDVPDTVKEWIENDWKPRHLVVVR